MKRLGPFWLIIHGLFAGCGPADVPTSTKKDASQGSDPVRTKAAVEPKVGMNLSGVVDWSSEWPFVDVFKTSRSWIESGTGPFTYDDHGNPLLRPGQAVETIIFRALAGHFPAGIYVATYDGTGEVEIKHWDIDGITKRERNRVEFKVQPGDEGILIRVLSSSPRDPIRNIRVWLPGFEGQQSTFHPLYLERLKPFQILRFMDWQRTNNSAVHAWSQRCKHQDPRWSTDSGVPVEVMCDLANIGRFDPWFCMPHEADDEYLRKFAQLVKEKLDPNRKVYLEYSNEVWNWSFKQAGYAAERGKKLNLGAPDHLRFYALRSVQVFDIFGAVFGGNERLVRVLSGQFASPSDCDAILKYQDAYRHADAFAVGAYFGYDLGDLKSLDSIVKLSPDALVERLSDEIDGKHRDLIRRQAKLANKYGLQLLAYESGQHLVGHGGSENNEQLTALFLATNRHPKMADLYKKQLGHWVGEGGGPFIAFAYCGMPSKFGSWGVLEYQDQPFNQAPRYRALADFSRSLTEARK